jgi:osmotically-inducible protein OsmY
MKKTDNQLQKDVADELAFDPSVDASHIGIAVKDGIVTLTGTVKSYLEKLAAEKAVKRVAGVHGVAEAIAIDLPSFHQRSDAEIAAATLSALAWNPSLPKGAISVKVESGWVTLDGRVGRQFQKDNARTTVASLIGVRGVSNLIEVEATIDGSEVKEKIRKVVV